MRSLFGGGSDNPSSNRGRSERIQRHSSGWKELLKYLESKESLRVLDIGPTSSTNINFLTSLGHSIYMANLAEEAAKPEWMLPGAAGEAATFDVEKFLATNLTFAGRIFDVVVFWDTADYLPAALLPALFTRLHEVMQPGGLLLAFFHSKATGVPAQETQFFRYHLTQTDVVEMQAGEELPLQSVYNNRQVENLLHEFSGYRFFLAKDNLREVIATR